LTYVSGWWFTVVGFGFEMGVGAGCLTEFDADQVDRQAFGTVFVGVAVGELISFFISGDNWFSCQTLIS
jgi:hypothetical protein